MKTKITKNDIATEICQDDFIQSLKDSVIRAGGIADLINENLTVADLKEILAQNGVRFQFCPTARNSSVSDTRILDRLIRNLNIE